MRDTHKLCTKLNFVRKHQIKPGAKVRLAHIETQCKAPFEGKRQAKKFTTAMNFHSNERLFE